MTYMGGVVLFVCLFPGTYRTKTNMASEGKCFLYFKRVTTNTAIYWPSTWQASLTLWSEDILSCKMKSILICFSAQS